MSLRRSEMNRGTVGLRRRRLKAPKLTPKRQEKRERRAEWAVAVKARDPWCEAGRNVYVHTASALKLITLNCTMRTTDAHHVLPKSSLGPDEMWNGLGCCNNCHMAIHAHRIEAQALGLLAHWGDASPWPRETAI